MPYTLIVPATSIVVALASTGLGLGAPGIIGGAVVGFVWSTAIGAVVNGALNRPRWSTPVANGFVFLGIVAAGPMLGGGVMYELLMRAAVAAPDTVLSAMMQPTIPFFIALNTPLELLVVPGAVFANWRDGVRRRRLLVAAVAFYVLRVWSYLGYVPGRMEIASRPLSPADVEWFQRSLGVDYRPLLVAVVLVAFTATALAPFAPSGEGTRIADK
jgi:hypothetical protein